MYFLTVETSMTSLNLPLSVILYETANSKNGCVISQMLLKEEKLPSFQQIDKDKTKKKYQGASQFSNDIYKGKPQKFVCCHDYASLYPSIIIGFNISPETLRLEPSETTIAVELDDENFPKGTIVYFEQNMTAILPTLCKSLIDKRKLIKA